MHIKVNADKTQVTITIDLTANLGPSKSGKTIMVATTNGNALIPGTDVTLGLNAYRKPTTA